MVAIVDFCRPLVNPLITIASIETEFTFAFRFLHIYLNVYSVTLLALSTQGTSTTRKF